jgi:alkylated DNA repair dioxygenase AlkB
MVSMLQLPGLVEADLPEGMGYRADFVTAEEESALLGFVESLAFEEVRMHGVAARRTVRHFGRRYGYEGGRLLDGDPLPAELLWLRSRCADLASLPAERFAEALVTRYPPGAGIGWHRDAPGFGARVAGVSLLSACRMRFQRSVAGRREVRAVDLAPRSAYVLGGGALVLAAQHPTRARAALLDHLSHAA